MPRERDQQRVAIGRLGHRRDLQLEHVGRGFHLVGVQVDTARGGDRRHERGIELDRGAVLRDRTAAQQQALFVELAELVVRVRAHLGCGVAPLELGGDLRQTALETGVVALLAQQRLETRERDRVVRAALERALEQLLRARPIGQALEHGFARLHVRLRRAAIIAQRVRPAFHQVRQ